MATPKTPQDHRPASAKQDVTPEVFKVEYDGETYAIDPQNFNDVELIEAMASMDESNPMTIATGALKMLQISLGKTVYDQFKADQIAKHGRCTTEAVMALFDVVNDSAGN